MSSEWTASIPCIRRAKARTEGWVDTCKDVRGTVERRNTRPVCGSYLCEREGYPTQTGLELSLQLFQTQSLLPAVRETQIIKPNKLPAGLSVNIWIQNGVKNSVYEASNPQQQFLSVYFGQTCFHNIWQRVLLFLQKWYGTKVPPCSVAMEAADVPIKRRRLF